MKSSVGAVSLPGGLQNNWHKTPNGTQYSADLVWIIQQTFNSVEAARGRVSLMYGHYLGRALSR